MKLLQKGAILTALLTLFVAGSLTPASAKIVGDCQATANAYATSDIARIKDGLKVCAYIAIRHEYYPGGPAVWTTLSGGTGDEYWTSVHRELSRGQARTGPNANTFGVYAVPAE